MRWLVSMILLVGCIGSAVSQDSIPGLVCDTFECRNEWIVPTAVGAVSTLTGAIMRSAMPEWSCAPLSGGDAGNSMIVDIAQYVPVAFPWVLKLSGEPTRSGWGRMAISQGTAVLVMAGSVELLKRSVSSPRPDGSDARSFPSGHTAWAFLGATTISKELGYRSPWYTIGAYTFATGIAAQRVIDERHFPCDVVAGAGIGILTAQLGYYVGDLIFKDRQLDELYYEKSIISCENRPFLSLHSGVGVSLFDNRFKNYADCGQTYFAEIKGGVPVASHWGVSGALKLQATPIFVEENQSRRFESTHNAVGLSIAPYYWVALGERCFLTAEIGGGYKKYIKDEVLDVLSDCGRGAITGFCGTSASFLVEDGLAVGCSAGFEYGKYEQTLNLSLFTSINF